MTIRADIRQTLETDATLTGILTGGIYDASELPQDGLTPNAAPSAFDSFGRVLPCAVIRFRDMSETEIVGRSRRRFFEIYAYQNIGMDQVDAALARCRALLHPHQQYTTDGGQVYFTHWVDSVGDLTADELDGAAMGRSRYYINYFE